MKIYQKILVLFCSAFISILTQTNANATTSTLYEDIDLPLPRACLPEEGRLKKGVDTENHQFCHCPPVSYCTQKVTYNGKERLRLSKNIMDICCEPSRVSDCRTTNSCPVPPIPPTVIPPQACEVHYFKYAATNTGEASCNPPDYTHIGTRAAGYCTIYQDTTGLTDSTLVIGLNTCLAGCDADRTAIRNDPNFRNTVTNSLITYDDIKLNKNNAVNRKIHQKMAMVNQIRLRNFVQCRRGCFDTNGFNNGLNASTNTLMQDAEIDLNRWIVMPLVDNATDDQLAGVGSTVETDRRDDVELEVINTNLSLGFTGGTGTTEAKKQAQIRRNTAETIKTYPAFTDSGNRLRHFTAKIYGPIVTHVFNQRNGVITNLDSDQNPFRWFFDNTHNIPDFHNVAPYNVRVSNLEDDDFVTPRSDLKDNNTTQVDYFNRQINAAKNTSEEHNFRALKSLSNPPSPQPPSTTYLTDPTVPTLPNSGGISCNTYAYIGLCVTIYTNSSGCETCLAPETKITMADGTLKVIKDLKEGEQVKAPESKTAIIESVAQLDWKDLTLYNINDGQLRLTADHPIMTTQGWRAVNYSMRKHNKLRYGLKNVKTLKIGDIIVTQNGELPVTRIMPEAPVKDGKTFNLKLKGNTKGFYANGILVRSQN